MGVLCTWVKLLTDLQILGCNNNNHLTASFPGQPGYAGTRNVKPIWILLEQETVSGSVISWAICKSAPRSRQITMPVSHHSVFTGRMPFLPPNQQRQSTEGCKLHKYAFGDRAPPRPAGKATTLPRPPTVKG